MAEKNAGIPLLRLRNIVALICLGAIAQTVGAQTIIGPSPPDRTAVVTVTSGTTTVVGSTNINVSAAANATNVTGGTLNLDTAAGPSPGPILVQSVNGVGLRAANGSINVPSAGVTVQTSGTGNAVATTTAASSITLNGVGIKTTGPGTANQSVGIRVTGGTVNINGGTIETFGDGAGGIGIQGSGSQVIGSGNLSIVTEGGSSANGIAVAAGSGFKHGGPSSSLNVEAKNSAGSARGLLASGVAALIDVTATPSVTVSTAASTAVHAAGGGKVRLGDATIKTSGASVEAVFVSGSDSEVTAGNLEIETTGNAAAMALHAASEGLVAIKAAKIKTVGGNAYGVLSEGAGTSLTAEALNVETAGANAVGLFARRTATMEVGSATLTTIETTGASAYGVQSQGTDTLLTLRNAAVTTTGASGYGLYVLDGGELIVNDSTVSATATSAFSARNGAGYSSTTAITNSELESDLMPTIFMQQGIAGLQLTACSVSGNDRWLQVRGLLSPPAQATLTATGSNFTGSALTEAAASSVLTLNKSVWNLTGDSNLSDLENGASSQIDFAAPSGGVYKTLTVKNYTGAGGTLAFNTHLGDDSSPSDVLIIDGGLADGLTLLEIRNAGGPGAQTIGNGILVAQAVNGGTLTPGMFALAGTVSAGDYVYRIDYNGNGNVYLVSVKGNSNNSGSSATPIPVLNLWGLSGLVLLLFLAAMRRRQR